MDPSFNTEFSVDGTNDLTNRIILSDLNVNVGSGLNYDASTIDYDKITYTVTLEFDDYTETFPTDVINPTNDSNISKTYPFYYSDEANVKVELTYDGVGGSILTENTLSTPIQPFELVAFEVVEANEDYTPESTRVRGEIQYIGRIDRYDISIVDISGGITLDSSNETVDQTNPNLNNVFKNLENNTTYPITVDDVRNTVNIFREQVTFDISDEADFDKIELHATTAFGSLIRKYRV